MTVITIQINESNQEILPGIPKFITLETNIPANIFYTLDGTIPTTYSNIYLDRIDLPPENVLLKFFASNGVDESPVLEQEYVLEKYIAGKMFANVTNAPLITDKDKYNLYPFGSTIPNEAPIYDDIALVPVDDPSKPNISNGFDEDGNPTNFTDQPLNSYPIIDPPGVDSKPSGIGVYAKTTIQKSEPIFKFSSSKENKFLDGRALVLYQDANDPNIDPEVSNLNKQFFTSQNLAVSRDGAILNTLGFEGGPTSGSFLNSYCTRTGKTKYYYYDNHTGRWIISEQNSTKAELEGKNLCQVVFGRGNGSQYVYRWYPFVGRRW